MRRLLALVVLVTGTTLALATPAHAGGPTSVLVTDPASGRAAALYTSESAYQDLDRLLADVSPLDGEPSDLGSHVVNVTWMAHDVSPWRTQQLWVDAAGGPVLATYGGDFGSQPDRVTWARVGEGNLLLATLDELFIPNAVGATAPAPAPVVHERVVTETAWWSLAGWRWLVLGLLVGAGAALLVVRRREPAPASAPTDLEPGAELLTR